MTVLALIFTTVLLAVFGQLSMKRGMNNIGQISITDLFGKKLFSVISESYVVAGVILYITASALWLVVLSREELSFAYPLIGVGYIITAILARIFFGENLTFFRILGIILIALGAYFVITKW